MLLVTLTVAQGCATPAGLSSYRVTLPVLQATPRELTCHLEEAETTCVVMLRDDLRALVRELKAACLALGGSPGDCQAVP
ncbi:MAG TPA: hypothetical protein VGV13_14300 [Methylomirabilota bacterium]|jgi:hypothetical protein|nr:hypothetical protein [Methylomirabilota bacterium]